MRNCAGMLEEKRRKQFSIPVLLASILLLLVLFTPLAWATCPSGYILEDGICKGDPVCSCGEGCYDIDDDICKEALNECTSGYNPRSGDAHCYRDPDLDCPTGTTFANGRCEVAATYGCPYNSNSYASITDCNSNCSSTGECISQSVAVPDHHCKYQVRNMGCFGVPQHPDYNTFMNTPYSGECTAQDRDTGTTILAAPVNFVPPWCFIGFDVGLYRTETQHRCSLNNQTYGDAASCSAACAQSGICSINPCPANAPNLDGSTCWAPVACPSGGTIANNECTIARACNTSEMSYNPAYDDGQTRYCAQDAQCPFGGTLVAAEDKCHIIDSDSDGVPDLCEAPYDISAPTISLLGNDPVHLCYGDVYTDLGAIAMDDCLGDITGDIVFVNPVNTSISGTYAITYDVQDGAGNSAAQVTRTAYVDIEPPVITLNGENPLVLCLGSAYQDPGAVATDNCHGDLSGSITVDNPVNMNQAGNYTVTYNVTDSAGNLAQPITRTVVVMGGDQTVQIKTIYDYDAIGRLRSISKQVQ